MSNFDHLDLDGHALRLLLTVAEEGSVTRAAARLDCTQSAVSHALDKLREITGDPLFVRSGRGIVATAQAAVLARRARLLLDDLRAFSQAAGFEPSRLSGPFTVAANDLQRDLLLPPLLRRLRAQAPELTLRVIPSGAPRALLLRDGGCDLLITPRPPDASDIVHRRLFEDRYRVFFDAGHRAAPADRAAWLSAEHVTVRYEDSRSLDIDDVLAERGLARRFVATVPGMAGVAALLQGGPWLATLPSRVAGGVLRGLANAPVPVPTPRMPMYAVWHRRMHEDPAHRWVRGELDSVVAALLAGPEGEVPWPVVS
jgi:DNA-binding transcriptional LysR family regulator